MIRKTVFSAFFLAIFSLGSTSAFSQGLIDTSTLGFDIQKAANRTRDLGSNEHALKANANPDVLDIWIECIEKTTKTLEKFSPRVERFNDALTLGQYGRTMEMLDASVERSTALIEERGTSPKIIARGVLNILATSAKGTAQTGAGAFITGFSAGKATLLSRKGPQKAVEFFQSARNQITKPSSYKMLRNKFDKLARTHLVPKYKHLDPKLKYGYTGSFRTGVVGNPEKTKRFGQAIDLSNFDIDFWIKSKVFHPNYGKGLHADIPFRELLNKTPGFKGLRNGKDGFSIKFLSPQN